MPHNEKSGSLQEDEDESAFDVRDHINRPQLLHPTNGLLAGEKQFVRDADDVADEVFEAEEPVERCGILCFKPDFLQKFRNMKMFLLVFIITGLSQGMYYSYWNMTLSSIEKRFQIPSQTTGIITAINDVSHIAVVLLVAHFCGRGHRPRFLAVGSLIVGIAILMFATPEMFAPKWDADARAIAAGITGNSSLTKTNRELCLTSQQAIDTADKCDAESQAIRNDNMWALILLGVAQILLGIGTTAPIVLAMPFIDDNVKTKNAPVYFALGLAGRFVGPLIGVFLGGYCLSTYVDLSQSPKIAQTDPRWMGAWYLGYLIIGACVCLTSCLYLFFPAKINIPSVSTKQQVLMKSTSGSKKGALKKAAEPETIKNKLAAMPKDMKRLLVNRIFMCRLFNDCIDMLVVSGYFNFSSKYIEFHFRMSPAQAGRASGLSSILAMGLGATVGGLLIRRFKLQPKQVAFGILLSSFLTAICYFFLMMVRCEPRNLYSTTGADSMLIVDTSCTNSCNCAGKPFSPVCHENSQVNYYSPCHAGCSTMITKDDVKYYTGCACLANATIPAWSPVSSATPPSFFSALVTSAQSFLLGPDPSPEPEETVKRGFCEGGCSGFWTYVAISASFKFIGMLPFSGNQMLSFRIVDADLKPLSKAMQTFAASLFAFIPGPIIMGALIDSTCKLWNTQACGKKGACLIYDLDSLRLKMHLYVGVIKTIACIMDIYVFFKVRKMSFDRDAVKPDEEAGTGSVKDLTNYD